MNTKPKPPIMETRPGPRYISSSLFGGMKTIETYQKLEDGKWVEYNKETNLKTGRIF